MSADLSRRAKASTDVPRSSFLARLTGRVPKETALAAIRNLVATTPYEQVSNQEITSILAKSRLSRGDAAEPLAAIFADAVRWLASDRELGKQDRANLAALARTFGLDEARTAQAVEQAVTEVFAQTLRELVADGTFSPAKRAALEALASELGMTDRQTQIAYETAAVAALQAAFDAAISDRRYSPFRMLAAIDQAPPWDLPTVETAIRFQPGERCHFFASGVSQRELRTATRRFNYSGPTARIPLMKGIYWRAGSLAVQRLTADVLTAIDTVEVYITSRQVFLRGEKGNSSITLGRLAHFTVFPDGLQLEKQTGRDVFLSGSADWELAGAYLNAVVVASRGGRRVGQGPPGGRGKPYDPLKHM